MTPTDEADKVTIMTIHAAKGLEFDTVFLAGWEEGVFPSQRALDEGGLASLEEERRLAYVAITRARRTLHHPPRRQPPHLRPVDHRRSPRASSPSCPTAHVEQETTHERRRHRCGAPTGRSAPIRSPTSRRGTGRGPGWQRAAAAAAVRAHARPACVEARASAVSFGNPGRSDIAVGQRVFHTKFGYGTGRRDRRQQARDRLRA